MSISIVTTVVAMTMGAVIIPWKYKEQSYPRIIRMTATTLDEELEELNV